MTTRRQPLAQPGMTAEALRVTLLTSAEPGRRNRRTIDAVLVALAAVVAGLTAVVARSAEGTDVSVARALTTVLGWAGPLWRTALVALLALAVVLALEVIVRRRWDLLRDVAFAVLGVGGVGAVLGRAVEADWSPLEAHLFSRWGYPELRVAFATAIVVVVGPELVRWVRVLATWLVPLAALGAVAIGAALPSAALAALALGARRRRDRPPGVRLRGRCAARRAGAERAGRARRPGGRPRAGRAPARRLRRVRRPRRRRPAAQGSRPRPRRAGHAAPRPALAPARVPRSATERRGRPARAGRARGARDADGGAGRRPRPRRSSPRRSAQDGDALVVTHRARRRAARELAAPSRSTDATLGSSGEQVARLHAAGISHGRLNASNVIVVDDGPMLVDFAAATLGAPQSALDIDVAELLVACTVLVGPERALAHGARRRAGATRSAARCRTCSAPRSRPHLATSPARTSWR